MKREDFITSLDILQPETKWDDTYITIGGGEPTLHPDIELFVYESLVRGFKVGMVTNGSNEKISLRLINLMHNIGAQSFSIRVSYDQFHDLTMISNDVIEASGVKYSNISTVVKAGRARTNRIWNMDYCPCDDAFILPDGRVKMCGCSRSPVIGHIADGTITADILASRECYKSEEGKELLKDFRERMAS